MSTSRQEEAKNEFDRLEGMWKARQAGLVAFTFVLLVFICLLMEILR